MNRGLKTLLILGLMTAAPAWAGKIGFVDAEAAVKRVREGQKQMEALEAWSKTEQAKVEAAAKRVTELRQEITRQREVASKETLDRLNRDELEARRAFEDAKRSFEREVDAKQNEFLGDVAVKVGRVASEYAEANGYDAIFVLDAQPLIYVSDESNLTDTIVRLYDQRFPAQ